MQRHTLPDAPVSCRVTYYQQWIAGALMFLLAISASTGSVFILRRFWWWINAWSEVVARAMSFIVSFVLEYGLTVDRLTVDRQAKALNSLIAGESRDGRPTTLTTDKIRNRLKCLYRANKVTLTPDSSRGRVNDRFDLALDKFSRIKQLR